MKQLALTILTMVTASIGAAPGFAQISADRDYWGQGWGYGHMMFGGIAMIIFWGGIILLIVLLVRWLGPVAGGGISHAPRQSALEILQERFARGEIDKAEFEDRKKTLQDKG